MSIARAVLLVPLLTLAACGSSQTDAVKGGDGGRQPGGGGICDPFGADPSPIALGTVIAVGQDAAGAIYVVDQVGHEQHVFVSDASGALVRQRIAGSGQESGDTFDRYVLNVTDHEPPFVLQIDVPSGGAMRMGVVIGALKDSKTFVIGQQGEELTVLPATAIAGMPLVNLPGAIVLEYAASLPDGELLVVTRPRDDWDYTDFRVYLGNADAVTERRLTSATRALDGGSTHIVFDLDGQAADAYFPVVFADGGFAPGPATLTVAGNTRPLVRLDIAPAGAVYVCLP
jgi:hypothetical protein